MRVRSGSERRSPPCNLTLGTGKAMALHVLVTGQTEKSGGLGDPGGQGEVLSWGAGVAGIRQGQRSEGRRGCGPTPGLCPHPQCTPISAPGAAVSQEPGGATGGGGWGAVCQGWQWQGRARTQMTGAAGWEGEKEGDPEPPPPPWPPSEEKE